MAAYIAFIATLNLCLGYALGVYIGVMPGISSRRDAEDEHDEPIGLPEVDTTAPEPEPEPAPEEPPIEEPVAAEVPPVEEPEVEEPVQEASHEQILEGLAIFKQKLDAVSDKLAEAKEDRAAVDQCAGEMKQANDEYLDHTSDAVETLNSSSHDELSAEEENMRQMLNKQTDEIRRANDEIDELMADDDTEAMRQKLMQSNEQLAEAASEVEESIPEPASETVEPEESNEESNEETKEEANEEANEETAEETDDPLARLDSLLGSIDDAISDDEGPLQVATLSLQFEGDEASEHTEALLKSMEALVTKELKPGQKVNATPEGSLLVTLQGDTIIEANERCERIRQQVKETTFCRDSLTVSASLVCSLTDTKGADDREVVMARLAECLEEAVKLGESRTFHHDGALAAPTPPLQLAVSAQTVEF